MFSNKDIQFIHEPARLQLILCLDSINKADFNFLRNATQLSKGNMSIQMGKLKEKGLVTIEKMIKNNKSYTVYQITSEGKKTLAAYKKEILKILGH